MWIVLIPHLGSATFKTRENMAIVAVQNVLNGLEGKPLIYSAYWFNTIPFIIFLKFPIFSCFDWFFVAINWLSKLSLCLLFYVNLKIQMNEYYAIKINAWVLNTINMDNIWLFVVTVLVPHLGTATHRTENDMSRIAAQNILNTLEGRDMVSPAFKMP